MYGHLAKYEWSIGQLCGKARIVLRHLSRRALKVVLAVGHGATWAGEGEVSPDLYISDGLTRREWWTPYPKRLEVIGTRCRAHIIHAYPRPLRVNGRD